MGKRGSRRGKREKRVWSWVYSLGVRFIFGLEAPTPALDLSG